MHMTGSTTFRCWKNRGAKKLLEETINDTLYGKYHHFYQNNIALLKKKQHRKTEGYI